MAGALHNVQFCTKIEIEICFHERADITNAFSETYPNYSIDYRLFHIMKRIEYILVKKNMFT